MNEILINIAGLVNDSIVDGPGLRFTIFVQGCPHRCKGCHNKHTWEFFDNSITSKIPNVSQISVEDVFKRITSNPLLDGVTFSGGEPFCQAESLYRLGLMLNETNLDIIIYSGYTFEELLENSTKDNYYYELLSIADILIDGRFIEEQKSFMLKFKGSANQRIINCKESLVQQKAIELKL